MSRLPCGKRLWSIRLFFADCGLSSLRKSCFLLSQVLYIAHSQIENVTYGNAQCIQNEIVNVRRPVGKRQLEYLYCQRHEKSGSCDLEEIIQALIEYRQYDSRRNKHQDIAEHIKDHVRLILVIQKIHKRKQIDPAVEDLIEIEAKRRERKIYDDNKIYVHQNMKPLALPVDLLIAQTDRGPYEQIYGCIDRCYVNLRYN